MKRNKLIILLLVTAVSMAFSGCEKDVLESSEVPYVQPYASLQDFYAQHSAPVQPFTINNLDMLNIIMGEMGTEIRIPANSLRDSTGMAPSGSVNVKLQEVHDIKSMVLSHIPATSNGSILQSGGMFYLQFSANNINYYPYTFIAAKLPVAGAPVSGMDVFVGLPDGNTGMNWLLPDTATTNSFVAVDSAGPTYSMYLDTLGYGWINCDKFYQYSTSANVPIAAQIDAERNEAVEFHVYLLFPSINSAMQVHNATGPQSVTANNIPVGMQSVAAVIGVGQITGKAYFGKTNFTVTSSQSIDVNVTQMTDQEIIDALSNL